MAISDYDAARLIELAAELFPRDNPATLSLIGDQLLKAHYEPRICEQALRAHRAGHDFLSPPALRQALEDAHRDRGSELQAIRTQAAREMARRRQQDQAQRAAADAELLHVDQVIRAAGWRRVRRATRSVLRAQPWLANLWIKRGLQNSPSIKAMVVGELAKAQTQETIR